MVKRNRKSKRPIDPLLKSAREAAQNAYAPYSSFAVGAAVETTDNRIFKAANMENASYGLTMCAEVGALQAASAAGALDKVRRIAIVGGSIRKGSKKARPVAPCGRCRQLIQEAAMLSGTDVQVLMSDLDLKTRSDDRISKLLPTSFSAKDPPALMDWPRLSRALKKRLA